MHNNECGREVVITFEGSGSFEDFVYSTVDAYTGSNVSKVRICDSAGVEVACASFYDGVAGCIEM